MDIKPKKIVIIHASAGDGHRKAALALEHAARIRLPDADIEVVDALDCFPGWLKAGYPGFYLFYTRFRRSGGGFFAGPGGPFKRR